MIRLKPALGILTALLVSGCATMDKSECREADWHMIGLEDGARGYPVTYIGNHRKACAEHGVKPDLRQYQLGHESGLARFCTPNNGFKQGRAGHEYQDVCPAGLEGRFLAGYDTGRELHRLNSEIEQWLADARTHKAELTELEQNMQNVEMMVVSGVISQSDRKALLERFKKMQARRTTLEVYIKDLELGAARMQGEYDVLDSSHSYY